MKYLFLPVLFLCVSAHEFVISWSQDRSLEWSDFQGSPKPQTDEAALAASGITFSFSVQESSQRGYVSFETKVEALFYPKRSWYIKDKVTKHILRHEQLHFDITELYVRQLRYKITKLQLSPEIKNELADLHQSVNLELSKRQSAYDRETDHSRNLQNQANWELMVKRELIEYEAFSSN